MLNFPFLSVLTLVLLGSAAAGAQPAQTAPAPTAPAAPSAAAETIPPPPTPLRVSEAPEYTHCLDMIALDPAEAAKFAQSWALGDHTNEGAIHCNALALLTLGQTEAAATALEQLALNSRASAGVRASLYAQAGQAWLLMNDPMRAFGAATMALSLTPDDLDLLVDRAIAAGAGGEYRSAIDDLTRVLTLDPSRTDALILRATSWRRLEQPSQAETDITRALELEPDNVEALLERGILRQIKGDSTGARADWERTIALDPNSPTADFARQNLALLEAGPAR